jgi:hypothetical protein
MFARRTMRPFPGSIFALLLLGFSQALLGQAVNGTLLGTVTDPSGAVVGNATVTIVLVGQSVEHTSITNESGNFTEPDLPPGTYTVTVVRQRFQERDPREHRAGDKHHARVDVRLVTGSATETVEVTTAPPELQTDRADISSTIESNQIGNLPLSSGNSFQSLLNTVPGMAPVVFNNSQFYNANNDLSTNSNGQSSYVNLYQIEGIDDDQRTGIHIILVPPAASIQNVDITTNNFEAEFGRAVGTVVNVTLKSGTNTSWFGLPEHGEQRRQCPQLLCTGTQWTPGLQLHGRIARRTNRQKQAFHLRRFSPHLRPRIRDNKRDHPVLQRDQRQHQPERVLRPGLRSKYRRYGRLRGQHRKQQLRDRASCIRRQPHSNDEPGTEQSGTNRSAGPGYPCEKPQDEPGVSGLHAGATTNNFSQNLPFSKDAISYDIKSDYTMTQKRPFERALQPSEHDHQPGSAFRSVPRGPRRRRI